MSGLVSTHSRPLTVTFPTPPPRLSQEDISAVYDHAKCASVAQCPANCASVAQCPANCASVAQCPEIALLQEKVNVLLEITPEIIAEVADLRYESDAQQYQLINQQSKILALQAASNTTNSTNPVIPFNQTACAATNFSDFNNNVGTWVAVDWETGGTGGTGPGTQACNEGQPTATCAAVCANYNLRCNPCTTSRALSCTTPLFYALQQAGKSDADIQFRVEVLRNVPPPPPNAQIGTSCFSSFGPLTSTTNIGNNQAVCGDVLNPAIPTASWPNTQNFVDPGDIGYNNPATACSIPLRGKSAPAPGSVAIVQTGSVCYCVP